jgi:hypothetical protein
MNRQVILKQYSHRIFTEDTKTYAKLKWHILKYRGETNYQLCPAVCKSLIHDRPHIGNLTLRIYDLDHLWKDHVCKDCLKYHERKSNELEAN